MEYLVQIGTVTALHLLAVMSPGPDFIMCVRNALTYSRKTGIWTSLGFALGIAVHIFYSLAGLAIIISQSILFFNFIKYLGAGYLIYIGTKSLLNRSLKIDIKTYNHKEDISSYVAVKIGFLTNVLNPKVTIFFLSLFTLVISPQTPIYISGAMGAIMILNTFLWFSLVSIFLTQRKVRSVFEKFQNAFNKVFGGLLVALGIKIALSER